MNLNAVTDVANEALPSFSNVVIEEIF